MTETMGYFLRPQIAGKDLPYISLAKVKGSIRRNDADNTSAVPYFAGVSGGQTLTFTINGYNYSVAMSDNTMTGVISSLQAATSIGMGYAFSSLATAIDDDGALSIQLNSPPTTGTPLQYIDITGGTAALALGFDTRISPIRSVAGDLETTSHGRVGNQSNVSFINKGENLTASSVNRGLGRLAANMDVLYSDLKRSDAVVQPVSSFTISTDGTYITPAAATRIFNCGNQGYGQNPSKENLAPYFFLFDNVTKQPMASRVVSVTRGVPGGLPPYTGVTDWVSVGTVISCNVRKQANITISDIPDGRTVVLTDALISDIVVGDLFKVANCNNYNPYDNSKLAFVIEEIDSSRTVIHVRPASESERENVSMVDPYPGQPHVELNTNRDPVTESFGSADVYAGAFCTNVNLIVDPPLPKNASISVWAAQPISLRGANPSDESQQNFPALLAPLSDSYPLTNGLLSSPTTLESIAHVVNVSPYYVRWHGRVCRVPNISFNISAPVWVCWDAVNCCTVARTSLTLANISGSSTPSESNTRQYYPLGYCPDGAGTQTVLRMQRLQGEGNSATVGFGGDFPNIETAVNYLSLLATKGSETEATAANYPHLDLTLVSDVTLSGASATTLPKLKIRGVTKNVTITIDNSASNTAAFAFGGNTELTLENLTIINTDSTRGLVSGASSLTLRDIGMPTPSVGNDYLKYACSSSASSSTIAVERCMLNTATGVMWASSLKSVVVRDSTFRSYNSGVESQVISSSASGPSSGSTYLSTLLIENSSFTNWPATGTKPVLVVDSGVGDNSTRVVRDSYFSFGTTATGSTLMSFFGTANALVENCRVDGNGSSSTAVDIAIYGANCVRVIGGFFDVRPQGSASGISCRSISDVKVTCLDSLSGSNGAAVYVSDDASGNYITGVATEGIRLQQGGAGGQGTSSIQGNYVSLSAGTNSTSVTACLRLYSIIRDYSYIVGNRFVSNVAGGRGIYDPASGGFSKAHINIIGNTCIVTGASNGIEFVTPDAIIMDGNYIGNTSASGGKGIYLTSPTKIVLSNNIINLTTGGYPDGIGVNATGTGDILLTGNKVTASSVITADDTVSVSADGNTFKNTSCALSGTFTNNTFSGAITFSGNNRVSGNVFDASVSPAGVIVSHYTTGRSSEIIGNTFLGVDAGGRSFYTDGGVASNIVMSGNTFTGSVLLNPWYGGRTIFKDSVCGSATFQLKHGWEGWDISGNSIETATLNAESGADARVVFSENYIGTLSVTTATVPPASPPILQLTVDTCVFNYGVTIPDVGEPVIFSNNNCLNNITITNAKISGCKVVGTATLVNVSCAGNEFDGYLDCSAVSSFTSNYCHGFTSITGTYSIIPTAAFSDNTINSSSSQSFLSYLSGSGNQVTAQGVTLTYCGLSSSTIYSVLGVQSNDTAFTGCYFIIGTGLVCGGADCSIADSHFIAYGSMFYTVVFGFTASNLRISGCTSVGFLSGIDWVISSNYVDISNSQLYGPVELSRTTDPYTVVATDYAMLTSCEIAGGQLSVSGYGNVIVAGCTGDEYLSLVLCTETKVTNSVFASYTELTGRWTGSNTGSLSVDGLTASSFYEVNHRNVKVANSSFTQDAISGSNYSGSMYGSAQNVQISNCKYRSLTVFASSPEAISISNCVGRNIAITGQALSDDISVAPTGHTISVTGCSMHGGTGADNVPYPPLFISGSSDSSPYAKISITNNTFMSDVTAENTTSSQLAACIQLGNTGGPSNRYFVGTVISGNALIQRKQGTAWVSSNTDLGAIRCGGTISAILVSGNNIVYSPAITGSGGTITCRAAQFEHYSGGSGYTSGYSVNLGVGNLAWRTDGSMVNSDFTTGNRIVLTNTVYG